MCAHVFGHFCVTVFVCASARTSKRIISAKDLKRVSAHSAMMLRKTPKIHLDETLSSLSHLTAEKSKIEVNYLPFNTAKK